MNYRAMKFASGAVDILLLVLTWRWLHGGVDWGFSLGCAIIGGAWLILTVLKMRHLFQTYFDIFSRLRVLLPLGFSIAICLAGAFTAAAWPLVVLNVAVLLSWGYIYGRYRRNQALYKTQGHGPLPKDACINPPAEMMPYGTLILTSGRIATRLHEAVGHGETVVRSDKGEKLSFSSYMEKGAIVNPIEDVAGAKLSHGFYVALRPVKPLTEEQIALQWELVEVMLAQNAAWRDAEQARRDLLIGKLWLPRAAKNWLSKKFKVTGYDWLGLFTGRRAANRWTCIGACLELFWRMGLAVKQYGTGILGLGTGLLDPIMPDRFLDDPAFQLITEKDRQDWEASQTSGEQTGPQQ